MSSQNLIIHLHLTNFSKYKNGYNSVSFVATELDFGESVSAIGKTYI